MRLEKKLTERLSIAVIVNDAVVSVGLSRGLEYTDLRATMAG